MNTVQHHVFESSAEGRPDPARAGQRGGLGDADELEREVAVGPALGRAAEDVVLDGVHRAQSTPGGLRGRSDSDARSAEPPMSRRIPKSVTKNPPFVETSPAGSPGWSMRPL